MSLPPEVPDKYPSDDELLENIDEMMKGGEITNDELNLLLDFFQENADALFTGQETYFILGSYEKYPIRRLRLVENRINRRLMKYAFILADLLSPGDFEEDSQDEFPWTHCQFHLLAAYASYLVIVFEGRHAGPSIELGEIVESDSLREKSYILPRKYENLENHNIKTSVDTDNPYSKVQIDKFTLFDRIDALFQWETKSDLIEATEELLEESN